MIPYVVRVTKPGRPRTHEFAMPAHCPVCGGAIVHEEGEVGYFCVNVNCPGANARIDSPFRVQGRRSISTASATSWSRNWLKPAWSRNSTTFIDSRDHRSSSLERMADKSAQNVLASIDRSRTPTLDRVINGLGIRHVGEHTARQLALRFRHVETLMDASEDDLRRVRDIGDEVARSIREYFEEPRNREAVMRLADISRSKPPPAPAAGPWRPARQELRVDRHARIDVPRRGRTENSGGRRPRDFCGQPQDRFRRRRRRSRIEVAQSGRIGVKILDEREFVELFEG